MIRPYDELLAAALTHIMQLGSLGCTLRSRML